MLQRPIPASTRSILPVVLLTATASLATGQQASELRFEPNAGRWDTGHAFGSTWNGGRIRFGEQGVSLDLPTPDPTRRVHLGWTFAGTAGPSAWSARDVADGPARRRIVGRDDAGNGPRVRAIDLSTHTRIACEEAWPGIDVEWHGHRGDLEFEFVLQPGADLQDAGFRIGGADGVSLGADGGLCIDTEAGPLTLSPPIAWEEHAEGTTPVPCRFVLDGDRIGVEAPTRNPERTLVVDPQLVWSSYAGGGAWESIYGTTIGPSGAVYVTGQTGSQDYPTTVGAYDVSYNGNAFSDVFVTKIEVDGTLAWSTFVGGTNGEEGCAIAEAPDGTVWVVGVASSSNFPTTAGAPDTSLDGSSDAFVLHLSADGSTLLSSTFLGGSGGDLARAVVVAADGSAVVAGTTSSSNFPTTGASGLGGISDGYVAVLDPTGATFSPVVSFGGSAGDTGEGVGLRTDGSIVVGGTTSSGDFVMPAGAYDAMLGGNGDAFVLTLDPGTGAVLTGTLVGGSDGESLEDIAVHTDDSVAITGSTSSADYPTTATAYQSTLLGSGDAMATLLDPGLGSLAWSSVIGGGSGDVGFGVGVDATGALLLGGVTSSGDFPTTADAVDATASGSSDGWIARLDPATGSLVYATYVGGGSGDVGEAFASDATGRAVLAGTTSSSDFLLQSAFDPVENGPSEGFVQVVDTAGSGPSPITVVCDPASDHYLGAYVKLDDSTFGSGSGSDLRLVAKDGPSGEFGFVLVSAGAASATPVFNGVLCLDTPQGRYNPQVATNQGLPQLSSVGQFDANGDLVNLVGTSTSGFGFDVPLELPFSPAGQTIQPGDTWYFQCWYRDQVAPLPNPGSSANFSNVVRVVFP